MRTAGSIRDAAATLKTCTIRLGITLTAVASLGACNGVDGVAGMTTVDPVVPPASSSSNNLIYVVYPGSGFVAMYSWNGKPYTRKFLLGPLNLPAGACADKSGHVFVTSAGSSTIVEFAHGRRKPIATLNDSGESPAGCSVDLTSGRIAVTNYEAAGGGRGSVSIYKTASGSPEIYSDPQIYSYSFCAYDSHGDLFVDGDHTPKHGFEFAVLPHGGKIFKNLQLGLNMKSPGPMQWDGQDVALENPRTDLIYRVSSDKIVDTVRLKSDRGYDFAVAAGEVLTVVPVPHSYVTFWNYPGGGSATRSFLLNDQPNDTPMFITVST